MKKIPYYILSGLVSISMVSCTNMQSQAPHLSAETQQKLITNQPIIAYFTRDAGEDTETCACSTPKGYSLTPVPHGYYRILQGRDADGRFLVQDFFYDSQKPQTLPFWIKDPDGLKSFDSAYVDGAITILYENGKPSFKATFKDGGMIGLIQNFYNNGQLASENDDSDPEGTHQKQWYDNGKPASDVFLNQEYEMVKGQFWNMNGDQVNDDDEKLKISDEINKKLDDQSK